MRGRVWPILRGYVGFTGRGLTSGTFPGLISHRNGCRLGLPMVLGSWELWPAFCNLGPTLSILCLSPEGGSQPPPCREALPSSVTLPESRFPTIRSGIGVAVFTLGDLIPTWQKLQCLSLEIRGLQPLQNRWQAQAGPCWEDSSQLPAVLSQWTAPSSVPS